MFYDCAQICYVPWGNVRLNWDMQNKIAPQVHCERRASLALVAALFIVEDPLEDERRFYLFLKLHFTWCFYGINVYLWVSPFFFSY